MEIAADGRFRVRVPVRFRDLDAMGHAHHTLPLIYLEEARAAFWRELTGRSGLDGIDYVMAEVTVRYHARIGYPTEVEVALAVDHVGAKSFATSFELHDGQGTLLAAGRAVQVAYDYERMVSKAVDEPLRSRLLAWRDALALEQQRNAT